MAATAVLLNPKAPAFQMPSSFNPNAPEFKPVDSSLVLRPEAAEFIPMVGGLYALQAAAEAYQNKQKRQMPFATDEEWDQRIQKREKEVETIKSLQSYRLYIEVFPHDERGEEDPKTPDPRDRTVSKRMWKWNVEKWRLQLKSRCVYSRAMLLRCREGLSVQASSSGGPAPAEAEVLTPDAPVVVADEGVAPAGTSDDANMQNMRTEPNSRLMTMNLPEQPRTIPNSAARKGGGGGTTEAGYKAAPPAASTTAGTFQ